MPEQDELRMSLTSLDPTADRLAALRELFPDAFAEGALDSDRLKALIGQPGKAGPERYGLSWAGKAEALRAVQALSTGTLRPQVDQSVDWDTTGNLIIEGDNLEVLKLLQKSYHKRVKMIYIDPPYNTGNEFIYPDNFREGLQTYLEYTGQAKNGVRQSTNAETSGRYHSNWLTMMYPRLFLARNLLTDDGVIFVSIDDHEVHNLRQLMNEIFGEENFVAEFVWQAKKGGGSDNSGAVKDHEYVIAYGRQTGGSALARILVEAEELDAVDEKGPYRRGRELNKWGANSRREDRPTMFFPVPGPKDESVYPIRNDGEDGRWRLGKAKMLDIVGRGDAEFVSRGDGAYTVYEKIRTTDPRSKPFRTWMRDTGTTADGSKTVKALFGDKKIYDFPKPLPLLKQLLVMATNESDDIILDFFAGSGTTAHAVLEQNFEDDGERSFICVQLPEPTPEKSEARKAGYEVITQITRERVRRAAKKLNDTDAAGLPLGDETNPDRGFKAFRLDGSNLKVWNGDVSDGDALAEQLKLFAEHRLPDRSVLDVLYELLLKSGRSLTAPIVERTMAGQKVYDVDGAELLICLEDPIQEETLRAMIERSPKRVLCLDGAFKGNDQLKTNIVLQMKDTKIEFRTV